MSELRKYNTDALFIFPLIADGAQDFVNDYTPAAGDAKLWTDTQISANTASFILGFDSLSEVPNPGDQIDESGAGTAEAVVIATVIISGTVGGGTAAGFFFVRAVAGQAWSNNDVIDINGGTANVATADDTTYDLAATAGLIGDMGNGLYALGLTPTEMTCSLGTIHIVDSATKAIEDQAIRFNTFGNASALHAQDLDQTLEAGADAALVTRRLDHLVAVAESDDPVDDSIIAKMVDRSSTADWSSFVPTEDSLRAISEEVSSIGSASGGGFNFAPVGANALEDQINDAEAAVDKSTSPATVGIPVNGHAFLAGHEVTISGTANYNDSFVIDSVTANEVVIVATYNAEVFSSTDNIDSSIKTTTIEGVQTSNTFAVISGQDGVYHVIDDDGGDNFTIAYRFEIEADRIATEAVFTGFLNSGNDNALIQAYDFVGSAWETRKQFDGQNGSVNQTVVVPLLARNTGTSGVDEGVVFLRVTDGAASSNPTLNTDSFLVEAVGTGRTSGYELGQIWLDTVNGTDGATKDIHGTSDRPCKTMANVVSLVAAGRSPDVHVLNGSAVTLGASAANYSLFGDNWTLDLSDEAVGGTYIQGATVSGAGTSASEVHFEGCDVGTASVQVGHFDFCSFDGTVTHTLAGDYNYHNCYSKVAGSGSPTFAKTAGQAITAQWRNWQGGITFSGLEVGDTLTIGGRLGTVDLGSPGGAVAIEIRGTYKEITNVGSASVNTDGATKGGTGYAQNSIWIDTVNGVAGTVDYTHGVESNPVNSIADANTLAASLNINRFVIAPGSSITFAATQSGQVFVGDRWTLALGGRDVVNSTFIGAVVSGVMAGTGVMQTFINCVMNATSIIKGTIYKGCTLSGTQTVVEAGEFLFSHCYSSVAGTGTVTFDFGSLLNSSNLSVRHHSGGWTIENMGAGSGTYNATFEGDGQIVWAASCSATSNASIRGHWKITDNASSAVTETKDDITTDVDTVKVSTDKLTFTVANQVDSNTKAISDDTTAADRLEALMDGIVVAQVNDGSATTTAFAADGFTEATDDHFKGRLITFISGALSGQQTDITGYDAASGAQGAQEFTVTALTEAPAEDVFFVIH